MALNGPFRVQLGAGEILSFTANGTQTFSQVFLSGDAYTLPIIAQPATQNCAFVGNQYGTMTASATLQVTCVSGYSSGGGLIANKPAPLNYMSYRGNAQVVAGNGGGTACAGSNNTSCRDGVGLLAQFSSPHGMTIVNGMIYIADRENNRIRRFDTSTNTTTTFAGEGSAATTDGVGTGARLDKPQAITTDGVNLYVVEAPAGIGHLRKIHIASGNVTTLAGGGTQSGGTDCPGPAQTTCADGTGAQVKFQGANGVVHHDGFLYITEYSNNRVRRMNLSTGVVDTIAGNGVTHSGADNVAGTSTSFNGATGAAVVGNQLYVADFNGHRIRAVSLTAPFTVTAVTGTGTAGHADGLLASARFYNPDHLTTDGYNLFVTEYGGDGQTGRRLRRIDLRKGRVSTIAGNSQGTEASGIGAAAAFAGPVGVVSDGRQLFVAAYGSGKIFRVTDSGLVGYWPADPGVNPNDYNSDNASLNNGTVANGPLSTTADRYGSANLATTWNGTNQYVSAAVTGLPAGASARTLCAWFKPAVIPPAFQTLVSYGTAAANNSYGITLVGDGTRVTLKLHLNGGSNDLDAQDIPLVAARWSHTCAAYDGARASLYLNGKLMARESRTPNTSSSALQIGRYVNGAMYFNGSVADVRLYTRALSEGEINELAQDASSDTAVTGPGFSTGAAGLLAHYEITSAAPLVPSGPIGTNLANSGSYPIGIHGDAGGAFYFDGNTWNGTSSYGLPSGNAPRTLCIWIKPQVSQSGKALVAYGSAAANNAFGISLETNGITMWSYGNTPQLFAYTPRLNSWQHVCGSFDGTDGRVYIDGVLIDTKPVANVNTNGSVIRIGSNVDNGSIYQGTLDDVRIYNTALTGWQIRQMAALVPTGLVARFDFSGDRSDASGWENTLNNNGVSAGVDRYGQSNAAISLTSGSYLEGTMRGFPLGAAPRTLCVWTKPTTLFDGTFSEVAMYGPLNPGAGQGWGFGMDASTSPPAVNGRLFILDVAGDVVFNKPHGLNVWRHLCATYDGVTERLYLDGTSVLSKNLTLSTTTGSFLIGNGLWGGSGYFNGLIDDVRVYNRALTADELATLVAQPNKRIYVTTAAYTGNLGGTIGADSICMSDANKPATGAYKAMLVAGSTRVACTSANCNSQGIIENEDWVLQPYVTYVRPDLITDIFTANQSGIFPFGTLMHSFGTTSGTAWTGLIPQWGTDSSTAAGWTNAGVNGVWGDALSFGSGAIYASWGTGVRSLYCVEQ